MIKKMLIKLAIWLTYPLWIKVVDRVVYRLQAIELLTPLQTKMVMAFFSKPGLAKVLWPEDYPKDEKSSE